MPQNNDNSVFISQTSQIWGNVEFSAGSSAWFGTLIRSVQGKIHIGKNTHINDQTRIANNNDATMSIGDNVYIGSQCNLSDCEIADHCYIGDRTTIFPGAIIPENSFIAPNSLIISQTVFPAESFIQGAPASCAGYVAEQMRDEYYQSLSKMQRNIGHFRNLLPHAEQCYYLLQFAGNQRLLEELFAAGAGEFYDAQNYVQSFTRKIQTGLPSSAAKQEIVYAVSCPSDKLHSVMQVLNGYFKKEKANWPNYQIQPLYTFERPQRKQWQPDELRLQEEIKPKREEEVQTESEKENFEKENLASQSFWWQLDTNLESSSIEGQISSSSMEKKLNQKILKKDLLEASASSYFTDEERPIGELYPEFFKPNGEIKEELPNDHLNAIMLRSELHKN